MCSTSKPLVPTCHSLWVTIFTWILSNGEMFRRRTASLDTCLQSRNSAELWPNYICIDKACMVLRTAISNHSWEIWKEISWFIVDSYHYINHQTSDYLCRKWCNPAPLNGSAPNFVIVEHDANGIPHYKRAFNTQV